MEKIKTLSLFSGAGGLDIGFDLAGFEILACVEIEEKYCKTLIKNKKNGFYLSKKTRIFDDDVREFDASEYKDLGIECIIGGPPCQTFSAAGRRSGGVIGTDDDRGQLYEAYCNILHEIEPDVFVFENVYGLPGANGGEPWREIQESFLEVGYSLQAEVIDTADYGVPQHRERLIMVGTKSKNFRFPLPTHGPDSPSGLPLVSVFDAIKDIQDKKEEYSDGLGGLYGHLLPDVPEGLNYAYFTAEMGHPEPVFAWRSKFHDLLYKVDRDQPCRTIKANPGKFTGPLHWKNRHFTIDELKRLQTFPDDYEIVGSYGQVLEQIGNSVPPRLSTLLAESIKEQILRPRRKLNYPLRLESFKSTFRQRQRSKSKKFKQIAQLAIKEKYGDLKSYQSTGDIKPLTEKYYTSYKNRFERESFRRKPKVETAIFTNILIEAAGHIRLDVDESVRGKRISFEIRIVGLKKYLPRFDSLTMCATVGSIESLFICWKEIEQVLIDRSNFYTLIDIYGHYANRGDVVNVETVFKPRCSKILLKLIQHFSNTDNCGSFVSEKELISQFKLSESELSLVIKEMRELRFDIRTYVTHPIIGKGNILCTYPFPLLSPKALVMSKVKINKEIINERQISFA